MANETSIGIDLGTTNSVAAYYDGQVRIISRLERNGLLPSALSWHADSQRLLVGTAALNNWKLAPTETVMCIKRLMGRRFDEQVVRDTDERFDFQIVRGEHGLAGVQIGGRFMTPPEISAEYLKELKRRAENELKRPVDSAVITVPAYFEERQRDATRRAGEVAGLRIKKIIDEPTAAAIAYGLVRETNHENILVFDLGGGTFDLSFIHYVRSQVTGNPSFHVYHIFGDGWLGGTDLDSRVVDFLSQRFEQQYRIDLSQNHQAMAEVRREAEERKVLLSELDETVANVPGLVDTGDHSLDMHIPMSRSDFNGLIANELTRIEQTVSKALAGCTKKPEDISLVLLVGGTSRTSRRSSSGHRPMRQSPNPCCPTSWESP